MTTEKHGFMFISWAVYNLLKFKFSLYAETMRNQRHTERGTHGYVSEYSKVFAELNWQQLMTKNHFMTGILHGKLFYEWLQNLKIDLEGKNRNFCKVVTASPQVIIYSSPRIKNDSMILS